VLGTEAHSEVHFQRRAGYKITHDEIWWVRDPTEIDTYDHIPFHVDFNFNVINLQQMYSDPKTHGRSLCLDHKYTQKK